MATQTREQLKGCFKKGAYPTASQFADLIDSLYHKNDTFQINVVENLTDQLNGKYSKTSGEVLEKAHNALVVEVTQHKTISEEKFGTMYDNIETLEDGVVTLKNKISDIGTMLKNGATLEQAKAALVALGTDYKDVYSIALTLKTFLESADTANATINTWAEIENFLSGVSDTTSLTALMVELEAKIIAAVDTERNDVLSGISFQGEGNVVTEITHNPATKLMTVTKGAIDGGLFVNSKTVENLELATNVEKGDLVMQENVYGYNVVPGNGLQVSKIGLTFSFSKDGNYLALIENSSDNYPSLFKRFGATYVRTTTPETIKGGGQYCSLSADGCYMALLMSDAPYVVIYKNNDGALTKLTNIEALDNANYYRCSFSSDGTYLVITSDVGVVFYKRTGDNFVQIRSSNIAGRYCNCSLTYDGLYLTLTKIASNHRGLEVEIYKRLDDVFTKISGISASSGESITGGSLSYDGSCLAILRFNPEYPPVAVLDIYNRSNDTFSRTLTSPEFESSNTFLKGDCVISPDGAYVLVAGVLDNRIYK